MPPTIDPLFVRYLHHLNIEQRTPNLDALAEIARAHVTRVPFETVSKLYYKKTLGLTTVIPFDLYLDGMERFHFGGTCYANNYHLHQLLSALGYDADLCGAAMSKPDVHVVNVVRIDGGEFIVDAGNAAPFTVPIPRDRREDVAIEYANNRYVLSPMDDAGRSRMTLYRDGIPRHGYEVNPTPRTIDHFTDVIAESFLPEATFMNALLLVRFDGAQSQTIHNMSLIETDGAEIREASFETRDELIVAIEDIFDIPASITAIALDGFSMSKSAWG